MTNDEAYQVLDCLGQLSYDPVTFVWWAFDWEHDPELKGQQPQPWQLEQLKDIANGLKNPNEVIRQAVASGHGIGKSTLVAWVILWAISTCPDTRGVVTANTEAQLRTKTWPELSKWYRRFIGKELFHLTATSLFSIQEGHDRTWRIDAIPWSKENPEAFAGLHNQGSRILLVFDEASAVDDVIWEVAEGALTDKNTEIIWCAFGNPTRNTGRFHDCFTKYRRYWNTKRIDSRTVGISNKDQIKQWEDQYGEDSDFSGSAYAANFRPHRKISSSRHNLLRTRRNAPCGPRSTILRRSYSVSTWLGAAATRPLFICGRDCTAASWRRTQKRQRRRHCRENCRL